MIFLRRKKSGLKKKEFSKVAYSVLNYEQLLKVNGAKGGSGGGGPSGPSSESDNSNYSTSGNLSDRGYPSSTEGYDSSTPVKEKNAKIFAWDKNGDGEVDHFVNDIGGGLYYDPATGTTGNVSDLNLATEGLGGTRVLEYKINK